MLESHGEWMQLGAMTDEIAHTPAPGSAQVTREELHTRHIEMRGYQRSDGLFEVEGRVTDRKPADYVPAGFGNVVPAETPLHDMGVRLVFDEHMMVHSVTSFMDSTPFPVCLGGGTALQAMVGARMGSGWSREVRARLAGARSCTHLMELLIPMATAAVQSMAVIRNAELERSNAEGRPLQIDSCYAFGAGREIVQRRWPDFYQPEVKSEPGDAGSCTSR